MILKTGKEGKTNGLGLKVIDEASQLNAHTKTILSVDLSGLKNSLSFFSKWIQ